VKENVLRALTEGLTSSGFHPYLTSIGGSGLGILSPYDPANYAVASPKGESSDHQHSLREAFEAQGINELTAWVEQRGRWLYV
jgi:hypothetical protein